MNSFGSKQKDLVLIVCGSAASWMIQHIMDSKGGLYNRLTGQIRLLPFTLSETKNYLRMQKMQSGPKFSAWSGYCFENICLKHIEQIKYHLRIDQIESTNSPLDYRSTVKSGHEGTQIDMLIDR